MKREECKFVKYTASEGKSLKYKLDLGEDANEVKECTICVRRTAVIDEDMLVGEVEEISREEYLEWAETEGRNFGLSAL